MAKPGDSDVKQDPCTGLSDIMNPLPFRITFKDKDGHDFKGLGSKWRLA